MRLQALLQGNPLAQDQTKLGCNVGVQRGSTINVGTGAAMRLSPGP